VPIAVIAVVGGAAVLAKDVPGTRPRLDVPGAILGTSSLVAIVYACSAAVTQGWAALGIVAPLVGGVALLAAFAAVEGRVSSPLLPLRVVRDRNRSGANIALALTVAGLLGVYVFLTFHLQAVLGYSPVEAGLAFLPLTVAVLVGSGAIAVRLMPRTPPRNLMVPGLLVAALGVGLLTQLNVGSDYLVSVLPGDVLLGIGLGCVFVPAISTATSRVDPQDAGIASALTTTSQMAGGSIGAAR